MSLSPTEIANAVQASPRAALGFIDPLVRTMFGFEVATLVAMALVYARSLFATAKASPCASRS